MNAHANIDADMTQAVEEALGNVVAFPTKVSAAETELDRLEDILRAGVAHREQRIADRSKASKAKIASIKAEIARLNAAITSETAATKAATDADKKAIAIARAGLNAAAE